ERVLADYFYPFDYDKDYWELLLLKKQLWLDSIPMEQQRVNEVNDSTVWVYESKPTEKLRRLNIPLDRLMNEPLLKSLSDSEIIWITEELCFIQAAIPLKQLKTPKIGLTEKQSREMEEY